MSANSHATPRGAALTVAQVSGMTAPVGVSDRGIRNAGRVHDRQLAAGFSTGRIALG